MEITEAKREPREQGCVSDLELIDLRQQAHYYRAVHGRAVEREQVLRKRLEETEAELRHTKERLKEALQELEGVRAKAELYKQLLFGRKSERQASKQDISESGREGTGTQEEASERKPRGKQQGQEGHGRRKREEIAKKEVPHELPEGERCCPKCGAPFEVLPWTEDSEEIDLLVRLIRLIHKRVVYKPTCTCEAVPGIVTAPTPPKLIPKGLFTVRFWTWVILEKFVLQRPLFRIRRQLLLAGGLEVSQGTLTGGLKRIGEMVQPLYARILEHCREANRWHMDETRWMVFAETEGKTGYRWWLWVVVTQDACAYILDPSRSSEVPKAVLEGREGILNVDRYSAYKTLGEGIRLAFCWTHVRRDFKRVRDTTKEGELKDWAESWVALIGAVYKRNEERLAVREDPEAFAARDQQLRQVVEEVKNRADRELAEEGLHPAKEKALKSLKNHWDGLMVPVDHPEVPLDNNEAERVLRNPVVGRKNYYGSGAAWSGQLAASLFTIHATVERQGLNPRRFFEVYLEACAKGGGKPPENIEAFLPWSLSDEVRQALEEKEAPT